MGVPYRAWSNRCQSPEEAQSSQTDAGPAGSRGRAFLLKQEDAPYRKRWILQALVMST